MTKIGIIGGGQIAKMIAQAASVMGIESVIFTSDDTAPALQVAPHHYISAFDDEHLVEFAANCDRVLLESEHIDIDIVQQIEATGTPVFPPSAVLVQLQDKLVQKRKFQQEGIAIPRFTKILAGADALEAAVEFGFPVLVKARRGSRDGRGNHVIRRAHDLEPVLKKMRGQELYIEEFVRYQRELVVIVVRWQDGTTRTYPVVEMFNQANICHTIHCPAAVDEATAVHAVEMARDVVEIIDGVGVFAVEMFEIADNEVLLNEVVPCPHDAGHYTIEGVLTSQYENLIRVAFDFAPGDVAQIAPATAMLNILGDGTGDISIEAVQDVFSTEGVHVHWYGKTYMQPGTKLGHVTILGYNTDGAEKVGKLALSRLKTTANT